MTIDAVIKLGGIAEKPVSSSSSLVVMIEALLWDPDWEIVEPQLLFFFQKASSRLCGESRRHEL